MVVAIYDRGNLEFLTLGETEKGNHQAPSPDTFFEIGSITKTFTGLMLSRSIELNRVTPESQLKNFRPEWKGQKAGSIQLSELVNHRSGLPRVPCDLHFKDPRNPYGDYSEDDLIAGLTDIQLKAQPDCILGAHPAAAPLYSNWGMAVLGYALATQQGESYEALLHELVLDPLKLDDTTIQLSPAQKARFAMGYDKSLKQTLPWERRVLFGAGAIRATARNLIKYAGAYLKPDQTSLGPAIKRVSTLPYAWSRLPSGSLWHDGMTGGYASFLKIYPNRDLAVLYLTNTARNLKCFTPAVENLPCDPN